MHRFFELHSHARQIIALVENLTTNILSGALSKDPKFFMNINCMHVRHIPEYVSSVWNLGYITDTVLLEIIQRLWTKAIGGMCDLPYSQRMGQRFYNRLLKADLILL